MQWCWRPLLRSTSTLNKYAQQVRSTSTLNKTERLGNPERKLASMSHSRQTDPRPQPSPGPHTSGPQASGSQASGSQASGSQASGSQASGSLASPTIFSQVDVTAGSAADMSADSQYEQTELLREVLAAQDRTNEILEELAAVMAGAQKQRMQELHQWKRANPRLAKTCRKAAESLSRVQIEYLERITEEIDESGEDMIHGEFMLNEFVDRYGPRLAHLNGVLQVLSQLSSTPSPSTSRTN